MSFQYFNLQHVKKLINSPQSLEPQSPERRQFVKTMGFGVLAANPILKTISSFSHKSFEIKHQGNYFAVIRDEKVVWEISPSFFGTKIRVDVQQKENAILIRAKHLQLVHTHLHFDLEAKIYKEASDWLLEFNIPEFAVSENINFLGWLDGLRSIHTSVRLNSNLLDLNAQDHIRLQGLFDCEIAPTWDMTFKNKSGVIMQLNETTYRSDQLVISPHQAELTSIIPSKLTQSLRVRVTGNDNWKQLISTFNLANTHKLHAINDQPDFNFSLGTTQDGVVFKALWIAEQNGSLNYSASDNSGISFAKYFYLSDYSLGKTPEFFLSAKMVDTDQWLTNSIGSFSLGADTQDTELELLGIGNRVIETKFEPIYKAFQPRILGALALPSYQKNSKIRLENTTNQQEPKLKKQLKSLKKTQPVIYTKADKVEYIPKKPIRIKVLRPEDMVYLEFEFHNFKFIGTTNSTLKSPIRTPKVVKPVYNRFSTIKKIPLKKTLPTAQVFESIDYTSIELDNTKKKGIVIIYFPTQHTLEEAFYETSKNLTDDQTADAIKLPAKHLRAKKSRLVYELKAGHKGFALSMNELLDWSKFKLKVDRRAWIKLENIHTLHKPTYSIPNHFKRPNKQLPINPAFIAKKDKSYGVKIAQNTKITAHKAKVYEEANLNKVLLSKEVSTLKPSFNAVAYIKPKVEPISKMHTSIEAPALLYISPNQVNDFQHKIALDLQKVAAHETSKNGINYRVFKKSNDLRIKPILSKTIGNLSLSKASTGEIAELWHTHLGVKMKDGTTSSQLSKLKTIRALWAYDAHKNVDGYLAQGDKPFRASLNGEQRHQLVHLTSNYNLTNFTPQPVKVKKLILSNLGAYIDWHTHFKIPPTLNDLDIIEWEHLATLGRDHFVKIVQEGYLFPFGHRAALVTITERKFDTNTKVAANRQRKYIVVLEDVVSYERVDPNNTFIKFPFQEVKIAIQKTPNIDKPEDSSLIGNSIKNFLINVGGKGFPFDLIATDKEGEVKHLQMPLGFIEKSVARNKTEIAKAIKSYHKSKHNSYNEVDFKGQEIAYAESFVGGDTSFETEIMQFGALVYPANGTSTLKFHPIMRSSKVFIEAVDKITNTRKAVEISLEDDKNAGSIFASVKDAVVDFTGGSDSSGGFLTPNMPINALSKLQGVVAGELADLKILNFKPANVFKELNNLPLGKIFGVIKLADLFLDLDLSGSLNGFILAVNKLKKEIEALKNELLFIENQLEQEVDAKKAALQKQQEDLKLSIRDKVKNLLDELNNNAPKIPNLKTYVTESGFVAEYKFQPQFKGKTIVVVPELLKLSVENQFKAMHITTVVEKPFALDKMPSVKTEARFDKFTIDIIPLLKVKFNYLEFKSGSNSKMDVKVDMDAEEPIQFKGALSFVNNLQSIIPNTGFSEDGPYIDLLPTGVKCGFNISVPNIEVGVCMITNISLGAYVMLPFTGAPLTMGFNFCTRDNPFLLTISGFGGGGYFLMITTLEGIQSLEAAFEFGAAMSLNVGVASGSVSVMGGFYFKMELIEVDGNEVSDVTLSGYLRMNGRLSVLGMITVSLEFYLALNAVLVDGKVQKMEGTATIKVKVEVLFFSKTVSVTVRRELKGADADPKFIEMVDTDDWQAYCLAFAS